MSDCYGVPLAPCPFCGCSDIKRSATRFVCEDCRCEGPVEETVYSAPNIAIGRVRGPGDRIRWNERASGADLGRSVEVSQLGNRPLPYGFTTTSGS